MSHGYYEFLYIVDSLWPYNCSVR